MSLAYFTQLNVGSATNIPVQNAQAQRQSQSVSPSAPKLMVQTSHLPVQQPLPSVKPPLGTPTSQKPTLSKEKRELYQHISQQYALFLVVATVAFGIAFAGASVGRDALEGSATPDAKIRGAHSIYSWPIFLTSMGMGFILMSCALASINAGILSLAALTGQVGLFVPNYWYRFLLCYLGLAIGALFVSFALWVIFKEYMTFAQLAIFSIGCGSIQFVALFDVVVPLLHLLLLQRDEMPPPANGDPRSLIGEGYALLRFVFPGSWFVRTAS
ncbi:hypothetical protein HGRIS_000227 [Hohenbuehelia grisea]|uniref:Uncharacterized protein n=1 Tax=Hohenbuehelia grisea TaxID=104357 RepID=A0ABR3JRK8_9AGAR